MSIWAALGFIALGVVVSEIYHWRIWNKYMDGMRNGLSMREWKESKQEPTIKGVKRK